VAFSFFGIIVESSGCTVEIMPRRNRLPPPNPPSVTPQQGIDLLNKQMQKAKELLANRPISKEQYDAWLTITSDYLTRAFGPDSPNVSAVLDLGRYGSFPMTVESAIGRITGLKVSSNRSSS